MTLRSCFAVLAESLAADLADEGDVRLVYEYHAERIRRRFAQYPDLPMHQDSVAAFLHGFIFAGGQYVPENTPEQRSLFPVLGGTLLVGQDLPVADDDRRCARPFLNQLAANTPEEADVENITAVAVAFRAAGDVPMYCATLGGFCLGALYVEPWLPAGVSVTPLLAAALRLSHPHD
jgi:hypothetical protein